MKKITSLIYKIFPPPQKRFRKYDVAITGNLLGVDILLAKNISRNSLRVLVIRHKDNNLENDFYSTTNSSEYPLIHVEYYNNTYSYIMLIIKCRLVCSFTANFPFTMRKYYPLKFIPGFPPIVNIATGSDATELLSEKSKAGWLYRHHLNSSAINWMVEYPHSLRNLINLKIKNVHLWPFPALHVCADEFSRKNPENHILFAHTARIDFKINDSGSHRNSSKGSDRFIKAFIRVVQSGQIDAKCLLIRHGPDADEAIRIIYEAGAQDSFIIQEPIPRAQLMDVFAEADVVVDQFDVGGFGGTAIEAMSGGRPVMMHLASENIKLLFSGDMPPILNCWSEDEIYDKILECTDKEYLRDLGRKSREWVYRHYDSAHVVNKFLLHYAIITGHVVKDYEWNRSAYD